MITILLYYIITMSISSEISDLIFNVKEKLTDNEFKNIMDKLAQFNIEEIKNPIQEYIFTYFHQYNILVKDKDTEDKYIDKLVIRKKVKKVQLHLVNLTVNDIDEIINNIENNDIETLQFFFEVQKNKSYKNILSIEKVSYTDLDTSYLRSNQTRIQYENYIPVSLQKF